MNEVRFGNGARMANNVLFFEVISCWSFVPGTLFFVLGNHVPGTRLKVPGSDSVCGQDHFDIRAAVLLPSGFGGVLRYRIGRAAPNRLKARRRYIWKVFDDVLFY